MPRTLISANVFQLKRLTYAGSISRALYIFDEKVISRVKAALHDSLLNSHFNARIVQREDVDNISTKRIIQWIRKEIKLFSFNRLEICKLFQLIYDLDYKKQ